MSADHLTSTPEAVNGWHDVRVQFADWSTAETITAITLGPALDQLGRWWFLRKHPCWRLRLRQVDIADIDDVLDELTHTGAITRWWPTVYEPETTAFGGLAGMNTVHDLFCADSAGLLDYLRHGAPGLGRRELSILLLNRLMHAAGLDLFESGDVFHRVTHLRPAPTDPDIARANTLIDDVRALLSTSDFNELFRQRGPVAHAAPWLAAFTAAGEQLGHDAADGRLGRGLRAILTHVVIFHWNRLGLTATSQGIIAHAATTALLPPN